MRRKAIKFISLITVMALCVALLAGCGSSNSSDNSDSSDNSSDTTQETDFDTSKTINVVSREEGSGTRGAFIELFGIEVKENGEKVDHTTETAVMTNSTAVMMTTVAGDEYSIGYISLGSKDDTVKALKIDGAEATVENIENGSYKVSRPFNIVTKSDISANAQDFIDFIMSSDGQKVISDNGYIAVSDAGAYSGSPEDGKVVAGGSSSVTPVMEKLAEAYMAINSNVTIEVQQSDSTTGVTNAIDGTCDIGMASRDLKDTETSQGVTGTEIARDGIAVIVNNNCPVDELTSEQVRQIFTGEVTVWSDVAA
ncbi:MAG: substrate-binding domain-containing protein [Eubacterium sp.]|jgi:phosphate transport system substrate-binding protein